MPVVFQGGQSQSDSFCHVNKEVDKADGGGSEVDARPRQVYKIANCKDHRRAPP
jgi:hypothetical protein